MGPRPQNEFEETLLEHPSTVKTLSQAPDAALRRPLTHCKRNRMLIHIWRQLAHNPLHNEQGWKRACMGELPF